MSRAALFLVVGVLWCFRSLQSLTDPEYTDPGTVWDWVAVVSWSAALLALALALPSLARLVGGNTTLAISLVPAAGAAVGGVANLLEDGAQLDWAGDWLYLPGVVLLTLGLIGLTVTFAVAGRGTSRLLAVVTAGTLVGALLLELGGGVLMLAVWLYAASVARREDQSPDRTPESLGPARRSR